MSRPPIDWRDQAACKGATHLFFPERGDSRSVRLALALCETCPVRPECAEAGRLEEFGIWGGTSGRYRRDAGRPRPLEPCGTQGAYRRHRKRGEWPCAVCIAERAYRAS